MSLHPFRFGNPDVQTLNGLGSECRGLWTEVYGGDFGALKSKSKSWKPKGRGCKCHVIHARNGTTKQKAIAECEARCSTRRRKRRNRRK